MTDPETTDRPEWPETATVDRASRTEWPDAVVSADRVPGTDWPGAAPSGAVDRASRTEWPDAVVSADPVPGSEWPEAVPSGIVDRAADVEWRDAAVAADRAAGVEWLDAGERGPGAEWSDVGAAWRDYVAVGERFDELFDARAELGEALEDAEAELLRLQEEAVEDEEHLRAWHSDAAEAWEALVQRVGRSAAGPYPEPYGDDDGNPQKHLVRAQRTVSAPIRFPKLMISLRMFLWGMAGGLVCSLVAFGLRLLIDTETSATAAHVAAVMLAFAGLAAAPFAGFALARWRLSATTDDDRTDPALAGLAGGAVIALICLFVTIVML